MSKITMWIRKWFVPRKELDIMTSHRDAIRDHFAKLQKEYLELESKMMSQTGYAMADVNVSIEMPAFPQDNPFCWKMQCNVTRELTVALRQNVSTELLPYIAENFKGIILQKLRDRWQQVPK